MEHVAIPVVPGLLLVLVIALLVVACLGFVISLLMGQRPRKETVGLVSVVGGTLLLMIAAVGVYRALAVRGVQYVPGTETAIKQEAREYRPTGIPAESLGELIPWEATRPDVGKETLPEWVTEGGDELRVIRGSQQATPELARQVAMVDAVEAIRAHFQGSRGGVPGLELVPDKGDIERLAVRRTHTETIERTTGKHDFLMYRTYVRIDTTPSVMAELEEASREKARDVRSVQVFIWFAVLAGIAGLVSVFFRIDERLRGRYRPLLVAGTLVGGVFLVALPVMGKDHLPEISKDWVRGFGWGASEAQTESLPQSETIEIPVHPMEEVGETHQLLHEMSYPGCFDDDD